MTYKIACFTPVNHIKGVLENLQSIGDVLYYPDIDYSEALKFGKNVDIIFTNPNKLKYRLDKNLIENCSNLKYIVTASTGTNHIDLTSKIETISLTKEYDIINKISSTAEHAVALTLALIRNIPSSFNTVKQGIWDYEPFIGRQLDSLTVGIIGFGRLGKMYHTFMSGMGCKVLFHDPYIKNGVSLQELTKKSDIISLHVHLNEETKYMINKQFLNQLQKIPYIINTSRGDIVVEKDIIEALKNNLIKGYATDVISDELTEDISKNPLIIEAKNGYNIIVTPHIGGMTKEAQEIAYNSVINILKERIKCAK